MIEKARGEGATTSIIAAARSAPDKVVVLTENTSLAQHKREQRGIEAYSMYTVGGKDFRGKVVVIDCEENRAFPTDRNEIEKIIRGGPGCERIVVLRQRMNGRYAVRYEPEA